MECTNRESTQAPEKQFLFVYGTLLDPAVQASVTGRTYESSPGRLPGWRRTAIQQDGLSYPNIVPDSGHDVEGVVLEVTAKELAMLDQYEGEPYRRIKVTLQSGRETWVYTAS